ncbi:MAG TPA: hypothetical protein VIZ61_06445 [Solirubrobacterales bacterium]
MPARLIGGAPLALLPLLAKRERVRGDARRAGRSTCGLIWSAFIVPIFQLVNVQPGVLSVAVMARLLPIVTVA